MESSSLQAFLGPARSPSDWCPFSPTFLVGRVGPPAIGAVPFTVSFLGEGSPTEIDYRKKWVPLFYVSSLLKDLGAIHEVP